MTESQRRIFAQVIRWIHDLAAGTISFPHFLDNLDWALKTTEGPEFEALRVFHNLWRPLGESIEDPFHSHDAHALRLRHQIEELQHLLLELEKFRELTNSFHPASPKAPRPSPLPDTAPAPTGQPFLF